MTLNQQPPVSAEIRVGDVTTETQVSGAEQDRLDVEKERLDRHAEANATLAALFRRVFIR